MGQYKQVMSQDILMQANSLSQTNIFYRARHKFLILM